MHSLSLDSVCMLVVTLGCVGRIATPVLKAGHPGVCLFVWVVSLTCRCVWLFRKWVGVSLSSLWISNLAFVL